MGYLEMKGKDVVYVVFRIAVGVLFLAYGVMKLFGLWGMPGGAAPFGTLIWYAGMAELLIGLGLAFGVFVRLASAFGIIEMIVAYVIGLVPMGGWNPMRNYGQAAILFLLCFLITMAYGAWKLSLEKKLFKKEFF
jgi:putative oxidoreductase